MSYRMHRLFHHPNSQVEQVEQRKRAGCIGAVAVLLPGYRCYGCYSAEYYG